MMRALQCIMQWLLIHTYMEWDAWRTRLECRRLERWRIAIRRLDWISILYARQGKQVTKTKYLRRVNEEHVMGKLSKRKQSIIIMDKKGAGAAVDLSALLPLLLPSNSTPPASNRAHLDVHAHTPLEGAVYKLLHDLSVASSLKEQITLLQTAKQHTRAPLLACMCDQLHNTGDMTIPPISSSSSSAAPISTSQRDISCVISLLSLYLQPVTLPLRKSLEWVIELVIRDHPNVDTTLQTAVIREVHSMFPIYPTFAHLIIYAYIYVYINSSFSSSLVVLSLTNCPRHWAWQTTKMT